MTKSLVTTLGNLAADQVGWMLAHEHIFANFIADDDCLSDVNAVIERLTPELERAQRAGMSVMVDATAIGACHRPDIVVAVSKAVNLPILMATGVFKEPAKKIWVELHGEKGLCEWMTRELTEGMNEVRAAWIKLSVNNAGVLPHEAMLLRAAACVSMETGAVVGSHTVGGKLANEELAIFEAAGGSPDRFIWIHTQTEPDFDMHIQFARRGAWIEYDAIDADRPDEAYLDWVCEVLSAGVGDHLLLSQDRTGYNPSQPDGGTFKPYAYLLESFVPKMRARGVDEGELHMLLHDNPFRAYAR